MLRDGRTTRALLFVLALLGAGSFGCEPQPARAPSSPPSGGDEVLRRAFEQHTSNLWVEGRGVVERVLADDTDGRRHQRFILKLGSGQTLLVAHNVDVAPRISGLREGDEVAFRGEYEWNPEGGVIHWTHHDPGARRTGGWLKHRGKTYQ